MKVTVIGTSPALGNTEAETLKTGVATTVSGVAFVRTPFPSVTVTLTV